MVISIDTLRKKELTEILDDGEAGVEPSREASGDGKNDWCCCCIKCLAPFDSDPAQLLMLNVLFIRYLSISIHKALKSLPFLN